MKTSEELFNDKGGILDVATVPGTAGEHLKSALTLFSPHLEPLIVPSTGFPANQITPPSSVARFEFIRNWTVNAFAGLSLEKPLIMFHAGTPFALFELYNSLLAMPNILPEYKGKDEGQKKAIPYKAPAKNFEYIFDSSWPLYASLSNQEKSMLSAKGYVTTTNSFRYSTWLDYVTLKPINSERQLVAQKLYLNSLIFLFEHELGHIKKGHLELLDRQYNITDLQELYMENSRQKLLVDSTLLQSLEIDADSHALKRSIGMHLETDPYSIASKRIRGLDLDNEDLFRLWSFGIGALFLYFESLQSKKMMTIFWPFKSGRSHPRALIRMLNIFVQALSLVTKKGGSIKAQLLQNALNKTWKDLIPVAYYLGIWETYKSFYINLDHHENAILPLLKKLEGMYEILNDCELKVSERYFLKGKEISSNEYKRLFRDPFNLKKEPRTYPIDSSNEKVEIEFLDELDTPDAFLRNAKNYEKIGQLDNSLIHVIYVLQKDFQNTEAWNYLQHLHSILFENFQTIIVYLEKSGMKYHFAKDLAKHAMTILTDKGDSNAALKELSAAISLWRSNDNVSKEYICQWLVHRASIFISQEKYDYAIQDCSQALDIGHEELKLEILAKRGNCFMKKQMYSEAMADFSKVLGIDPSNSFAIENVSLCSCALKS